MKNQNDVYKLSNGVEIPCIGFGTWQTPDGDVAVESVCAPVRHRMSLWSIPGRRG